MSKDGNDSDNSSVNTQYSLSFYARHDCNNIIKSDLFTIVVSFSFNVQRFLYRRRFGIKNDNVNENGKPVAGTYTTGFKLWGDL